MRELMVQRDLRESLADQVSKEQLEERAVLVQKVTLGRLEARALKDHLDRQGLKETTV